VAVLDWNRVVLAIDQRDFEKHGSETTFDRAA
jgi:hypothetical protein